MSDSLRRHERTHDDQKKQGLTTSCDAISDDTLILTTAPPVESIRRPEIIPVPKMDPNSQSGSDVHIPAIPQTSTLGVVLPLALSGYEALEETAPTSMSGTLLQSEDFDISALDFPSITGASE